MGAVKIALEAIRVRYLEMKAQLALVTDQLGLRTVLPPALATPTRLGESKERHRTSRKKIQDNCTAMENVSIPIGGYFLPCYFSYL
jgi:hypothetical protein